MPAGDLCQVVAVRAGDGAGDLNIGLARADHGHAFAEQDEVAALTGCALRELVDPLQVPGPVPPASGQVVGHGQLEAFGLKSRHGTQPGLREGHRPTPAPELDQLDGQARGAGQEREPLSRRPDRCPVGLATQRHEDLPRRAPALVLGRDTVPTEADAYVLDRALAAGEPDAAGELKPGSGIIPSPRVGRELHPLFEPAHGQARSPRGQGSPFPGLPPAPGPEPGRHLLAIEAEPPTGGSAVPPVGEIAVDEARRRLLPADGRQERDDGQRQRSQHGTTLLGSGFGERCSDVVDWV